jgi:hypothetical protein
MDLSNTPAIVPAVRHDGWTEVRKVHFLEHLAGHGNVRAACSSVGMSHAAAYRLRRRDPLFARAWGAALVLAREASAEVLACRAIDGIEEEVWYRGEFRGTRRRYDSRLLLAHMARLDKLAENTQARADARRFDELVACVAGAAIPEGLLPGEDGLPPNRKACALMMAEGASDAASDDDCHEAYFRGEAEGEALWDAWFAGACDAVDQLLEATACTVSTVSTSARADGRAPEGA